MYRHSVISCQCILACLRSLAMALEKSSVNILINNKIRTSIPSIEQCQMLSHKVPMEMLCLSYLPK